LPGGEQGAAEQQGRDGGECPSIVGADAVEVTADQAQGEEGESQSRDDARDHQGAGLAQDQPLHVGSLRAEGDAHAEFVGAPGDHVGEQAIESGEAKQQGDSTEDFEQVGCEALAAEGILDNLIHGGEGGVGKLRACLAENLAKLGKLVPSLRF
jgi:hypothetical protein